MTSSLKSPGALEPGCEVQVVAPAGRFDRTLFFRGLGWLARHYRVRFDPDIFDRQSYLAGSDERRSREINDALRNKSIRALVCARGGFGCTRIIERLDGEALRNDPKWLVGFSDISALHAYWQSQGVQSLHAHNVTGLGPADADERERWRQALQLDARPLNVELRTLYPGHARGPFVGGNLAVVCAALTAFDKLPWPDGFILFVEEVNEAPYRIDRLLTQLEQTGVFDRAAGVVSGQFTACGAGPEVQPLLAATAARHRLPWVHGLAAGHDRPNLPLKLGEVASIGDGRLSFAR